MKQIVDKLNKIAKKINENVELSDKDLIIDSLDSITKAYGGTPNDSNLIVDKLDDIYNNIGSGGGGGGTNIPLCELTIVGTGSSPYQAADPQRSVYIKDGVLQRSASFSTETLKVYSPYALTGEEYNVVYFCNRSYASKSEALAAITNPVNVTPFAYEESDAWHIVLIVIDPTQPSSATIPSDQK